MDYLREGVSLRGYGQRDPLIEYQREGYDMFTAMMDGIKEDTVAGLFSFQLQPVQDPVVAGNGASAPVAGPVPVQPAQPGQAQPTQRGPQHARPAPQTQRPGRHSQRQEARAAQQPARGWRRRRAPGGPRAVAARGESQLQRAERRRVRPQHPARGSAGRQRPVRGRRPQRPLPVRLGEEVQDVSGDPRHR